MSVLRFASSVAGVIAAVVLEACSASQSSSPSIPSIPGERAQSATTGTRLTMHDFVDARTRGGGAESTRAVARMSAEATDALRGGEKHVVYVSDIPNPSLPSAPGVVNLYSTHEHDSTLHLVGQIAGLDSPTRLVVDRFGNLYVCQTDFGAPVLVFAPGASTPMRSLNTQGELATALAVDRFGSVFVSTLDGILVYRPFATTPFKTLTGSFGDGINDIVVDRDGNVYFDAFFFDLGGVIGEFAAGSSTAIDNLGFPVSPLNLALLHDGGMVLATPDTIDVFRRGSIASSATFAVQFTQAFGMSHSDSELFSVGAGSIAEYAFPAGELQRSLVVGTNDANFGVAVAPAPPLPKSFNH